MRRTLALFLALLAVAPALADGTLDFAPVDEMLFEAGGQPVRSASYTDRFALRDGAFLFANRRTLSYETFGPNGVRTGGGAFPGRALPKNATPLVLDEAAGRFYLVDRDRDTLHLFGVDGAHLGARPIAGGTRLKRRIAQVDVKTYLFPDRTVYLNFLDRTISVAEGDRLRNVRYEALHPRCAVFPAGGSTWFYDPRTRLIADLADFNRRFTGESLVAARPDVFFLVDRLRTEVAQVKPPKEGDAAGEVVALYAPGEKRGPFPGDVAVFPDGGFALLDVRDARIHTYTAEGIRQATFGTKGLDAGQMDTPVGIVAIAGDRLFVRDAGRGRGLLFDRAGRFLAELQDLIEGPAPDEFRAFLDRDGRIHLVGFLDRRHLVIGQSFAWMREFSRILGSEARYPRDYLTLTADGGILYFDSAKGAYETLRTDGSLEQVPIAEGIARFIEQGSRHYATLAGAGGGLLAVTEDGRADRIDPANGNATPLPVYGEVAQAVPDAFGTVYLLYANGQLTRVSPDGKGDWSLRFRQKDLLLVPCGADELYVAARGERQVALIGPGGRKLAAFDVAAGTVAGLAAAADRLTVFFDRDGSFGVARFRRRDVYKDADRYYTNRLYRMAAVRYEALLAKGHDGPTVRYRLYDCYRKLDRPELAERERLVLVNTWPRSAEANQAPEGQQVPGGQPARREP